MVKTSTTNPAKTETIIIQNNVDIEHSNNKQSDKENIFTSKIDLDYIPGLDDELKVIIPGKIIIISLDIT